MKDSLWKTIAIALISCTFTGMTSWLTFGLSRVSEADMIKYKSDVSIYVDKKIETELLKYDKPQSLAIQRISDKVDYLIQEVQVIKTSIKNVKPD